MYKNFVTLCESAFISGFSYSIGYERGYQAAKREENLAEGKKACERRKDYRTMLNEALTFNKPDDATLVTLCECAFRAGFSYAKGYDSGYQAAKREENLAEDKKMRERKKGHWITINGTHIFCKPNGVPASEVGKKIFASVKNPQGEKNQIKVERDKSSSTELAKASKNNQTFQDKRLTHLQAKYDEFVQSVPRIYRAMEHIADSCGAAMSGKDYAIKGADSLERKILTKAQKAAKKAGRNNPSSDDITNAFNQIEDVVRFTIVGGHEKLASLAGQVEKKLKEGGYNIVSHKNKYLESSHSDAYHGLHLNVKDPQTKLVFEVQIHSPKSLEVKNVNHKLYEKSRKMETPSSEKKKLVKEMVNNTKRLKDPRAIQTLWNE